MPVSEPNNSDYTVCMINLPNLLLSIPSNQDDSQKHILGWRRSSVVRRMN